MKKIYLLPFILVCLLSFVPVFAQTAQLELIAEKTLNAPVERMVWSADGSYLTIVTAESVDRIPVNGSADAEHYTVGENGQKFISVSGEGLAAAISSDRQAVFLYEPGNPGKDLVTVEPGFMALAAVLSDDGSRLIVDSADQIRTVIYETGNGNKVFDLSGFETGAPVYDSIMSDDGKYVVWHARGTFAVQNAESGSFGNTISLWDFASSYDLSPDSKTLAVGIVNEDYENGVVIFFDAQTGAEITRSDLGHYAPYALSYSRNGSLLWAADSGSVYLLDPKTGAVENEIAMFEENSAERILRIESAPDGKSAAVLTADGKLYLVH